MPQTKVLVIGNCTLDTAFRLPRFPKPGETMLAVAPSRDVGGKGANQAVAAARSGVPVLFCSALGTDENGRTIRDGLETEHMRLDYVADVAAPTDQSIIYVTSRGENSIVSTHGAAASMDMALVQPLLQAAAPGDIMLMQGNLSHDLTGACLDEGRRRRLVTVLNPAPIQYGFDDIWRHVDCAILNEVETEHLTACTDPVSGARRLLARDVRQVVITLGAGGALLAHEGGVHEIAAASVDAVDTTGAGDVFCGVFVACLGRGLGIAAATRRAVRAATLSVTRHGTQSAFPSRAEIHRILEDDE